MIARPILATAAPRSVLIFVMVLLNTLFCSTAANSLDTWRPLLTSPSVNYIDLAAGQGKLVVLDSSGVILSWPLGDPSQKSLFLTGFRLDSIAYGLGHFVVVGSNNQILISTNGVDWTALPQSGVTSFRSIAFGRGTFVIEAPGTLLYSTNAVDWLRSKNPGWAFPEISFAGAYFFFPFGNGTNFISQDGISWTAVPSGAPSNIYSIDYLNGTYVSIPIHNDIITSPDASNWTHRGKIEGILRPMSMAAGNGYLVTVGGDARAYSRNGVDWTVVPATTHQHSVIFANGVFISSGYGNVAQSDPVAGLELSSPSSLTLFGTPGHTYQIQTADTLSADPSGWTVQHTFLMPTDQPRYNWADPRPPAPARFYRLLTPTE